MSAQLNQIGIRTAQSFSAPSLPLLHYSELELRINSVHLGGAWRYNPTFLSSSRWAFKFFRHLWKFRIYNLLSRKDFIKTFLRGWALQSACGNEELEGSWVCRGAPQYNSTTELQGSPKFHSDSACSLFGWMMLNHLCQWWHPWGEHEYFWKKLLRFSEG